MKSRAAWRTFTGALWRSPAPAPYHPLVGFAIALRTGPRCTTMSYQAVTTVLLGATASRPSFINPPRTPMTMPLFRCANCSTTMPLPTASGIPCLNVNNREQVQAVMAAARSGRLVIP